VPPGFTHALLLRAGRVLAAGPVEQTLHSASLSATFGLPLRVLASDGRWTARMASSVRKG
jgi:iron complex transport system ATP-binding protein